MKLNRSKVLVTGANGFLATHLVEKLVLEGAFVVALIHDRELASNFFSKKLQEKTQVVEGSVCELQKLTHILNEYEIDTVFHLAAETQVTKAVQMPYETFETNIRGSYTLFEACKRARPQRIEKIIVASSDKAYGSSDVLPYQESFPLNGVYPYDVSKSCMDLIANSYQKTYNLPISIVRSANIYGEGDYHFERLIPGAIKAFLKAEELKLRSDGSSMRNYIYIDDIVSGYLKIAELFHEKNLSGEVFNFGTKDSYTVLQVVELIAKLMGSPFHRTNILNNSPNEILDQKVCYKKAMYILDWSPKISFKQGLSETINSYRKTFANQLLKT